MTRPAAPQRGAFFDTIERVFRGAPSTFDRDEGYYRARHAGAPAAGRAAARQSTGAYEDARPAYQLGHVAGTHDAYAGRSFDDAEADLRRAWETEPRNGRGEWAGARDYARDAYARGQEQRLVLTAEQLAVGTRRA